MKKVLAWALLVALSGCGFYHARHERGGEQTVDASFGAGKKPY